MKIAAGMRKITPSSYAEESYQASNPRAHPAVRGPSGLHIPDARSVFRSTLDPRILTGLTRAAQIDLMALRQSKAAEAAMTTVLAHALEAHYVPADMAILRRYGCAEVTSRVSVEVGRYGWRWYTLAEPMLLPPLQGGRPRFRTGDGDHGLPVPAAALSWFDDLAEVEDARKEQEQIWHWPGRFKVEHARWPRWAEIEVAWPRLGAWMAAQRDGGWHPR